MKTIIAATLIAVSSAFAEDVDIYVHESSAGGGPPSLNDYITSFRYHVTEGLKLSEGHDNPLSILQMNPEIKDRAQILMNYGFTRAQVEREFQIAIAGYEAERARKEASRRNFERLYDEINRHTGGTYNPYRPEIRRAIPVGKFTTSHNDDER